MGKTKDLSEKCLRVLRPNLELGEVEIARGRCDYFPFLAGVPNGSAYTFLVVTNDRIMWTDFLGPERVYDVRFSDLRSFSEGSYKHRWVVLLHHGPAVRMESISPKWYRPTSWHMPPTEGPVDRAETVLEFSRRETAAAQALILKLEEFRIPRGEPLRFQAHARPEPGPLVARRGLKWPRRIRRRLRGFIPRR
jgi:hypothetical protein